MLRHIVLFKLKNPTLEIMAEAKKMLLSMKGKVPQIMDMDAGMDVLRSSRSYDVAVQVLVKDLKALEDYQNDPYHAGVVKPYMAAIRENSVAMDYETDR